MRISKKKKTCYPTSRTRKNLQYKYVQPRILIYEADIVVGKFCTIATGKAAVYGGNGNIIHVYGPGKTINLTEVKYRIPMIKSVRAMTQVTLQYRHSNENAQFYHEVRQRQKIHPIKLFRQIKASSYFQLENVLKETQMKKNQELIIEENQTYFVKEGVLIGIDLDSKRQLIEVGQGQLLITQCSADLVYKAKSNAIVFHISSEYLQIILSDEYQLFLALKNIKQSNILSFVTRNNNLQQLRKSEKRALSIKKDIEIVPHNFCKHFTSKKKSLSITQNRIKCKSLGYENKAFYIKMRNKFHADLVNLNRQTYGKNYLYEKRLEISYEINQDAMKQNSSPDKKKQVVTYYEPCRMKQNFGHLKNIHSNLKNQITLQKVRKIRMNLQKKNKMKFQQCIRRGKTVFGSALLDMNQ